MGLVLVWTHTRGSALALQTIDGKTMTNLSQYLQFEHGIVVQVLKEDDVNVKVAVPSADKIEEYKATF